MSPKPRDPILPAAPPKDVNQRTGSDDRATPDSFGDRDEAAMESNPVDNPAIVTAVRGRGGPEPQQPAAPTRSSTKPSPESDPKRSAGEK